MFNNSFFPTPREVAKRMIEPYAPAMKAGALVLDPSAGKGDLLNACWWDGGAKKHNLFAIELEPDLCAILRDKEYRVVGDDFLQYSGQHLFDIIVMNPPFANGDDHLLKAWEIMRHGEIVCLLNAETIRNPYTHTRQQIVRLIENHGSVEYIGQAFARAERPTYVEVAMVRLSKRQENDPFDFTPPDRRSRPQEINGHVDLESQVARADFIGAMVDTYNQIGQAYEQFIIARERLRFYTNALKGSEYNKIEPRKVPYDVTGRNALTLELNNYLEACQATGWNTIFDRTKFRAVLTSKSREDFMRFQKEQGGVPFTEANIWAFFEMLFMNRGENMQRCVVEVFDALTDYHADNKVHWEGWKTNDAHRVNMKVIMPHFLELSPWSGFSVRYAKRENLADIDRVMCLLTGKKMIGDDVTPGIVTMEDALIASFKDPLRDNTAQSEFFDLRYFKKGTLHMKFRDKKVWQEFNLRAAKGKNWLPA